MGTAAACFDRRSNSRKRLRLGCKGSRQVTKPSRYYNLTRCSVPWVPGNFYARFPVSVEDESVCGRHPAKAPHRTREKTSGTQGRCSETRTKFQNILQTTASVKTHTDFTAPLIKKFKAQIPPSIPHSKPFFSPFYPLSSFHLSFPPFKKQTIHLHTQTAPGPYLFLKKNLFLPVSTNV